MCTGYWLKPLTATWPNRQQCGALAHAQAIGSNHSPQRGRISSNTVIGSRDIISLVG